MKRNKLPAEIESVLIKAHEGKEPTQKEKDMVATYIGAMDISAHHPVTGKEIPNPNPIAVDVSVHQPRTIEERVKHIMSVSSRLAQLNGMETLEEAMDFDIDDVFDRPTPPSPFEMIDHYVTMAPDAPPNVDPASVAEPPEPPPSSGGDPITPVPPEPTGEPV